ncbi:Glyceraldehyde-3-phosphate dehydrogenase [Galemys pyrenaicus]|uniref:Glyceraldehyde-3-phosphate dehydrogenase n=1 Tax=Galemys pyrenaicus TaxID=202257 RepID=A0A8J6DJQ3_GALPY|nr:Glyceraldehyde-3-phosphate dehydrogenase [Galemys pyrenaicus]
MPAERGWKGLGSGRLVAFNSSRMDAATINDPSLSIASSACPRVTPPRAVTGTVRAETRKLGLQGKSSAVLRERDPPAPMGVVLPLVSSLPWGRAHLRAGPHGHLLCPSVMARTARRTAAPSRCPQRLLHRQLLGQGHPRQPWHRGGTRDHGLCHHRPQETKDVPSGTLWCWPRAARDMVPDSTGAAKVVGRVTPQLKGKLTGMAPVVTPQSVVVHLTCHLEKVSKYDDIKKVGILGDIEDQAVSFNFNSDTHTFPFDTGTGIALQDHSVKLISWYDNEFGYSNRVNLLGHMASKE